MKIKSIRDVKNLAGKKVLLRVDYNVPMDNREIKDDFKIVSSLPMFRYLLRHRCKIIAITHFSHETYLDKKEPENKEKYSVKPLAKRLEKLLGREVKWINDCLGGKVREAVDKMKNKEVLMLENLRFYKEEENNDKKFAKELAKLADIYVNEAFAVSHRNHASVSAILNYLPSYAGLLIEDEIKNIEKALAGGKPLVSIIGGVKLETKIKLISRLLIKSSRVLIGGAIANSFIAAEGFNIGNSIANKNSIELADKLLRKGGKNNREKIILPVDVVVSDKFEGGQALVKDIHKVEKNDIILDIGPRTIQLYNSFIRKGRTLIWNGPMGKFEEDHFKHGTLAIARLVATHSGGRAFGVAGGGETVAALNLTKMGCYVDWVSTGGGAMLAYLAGDKMPGLKGIVK